MNARNLTPALVLNGPLENFIFGLPCTRLKALTGPCNASGLF